MSSKVVVTRYCSVCKHTTKHELNTETGEAKCLSGSHSSKEEKKVVSGFYAVKFLPSGEVRVTTGKVNGPLSAIDNVLGSKYSVPRPMLIDILNDFSNIRVKLIAANVTELRNDKRRMAAIRDEEGWFQPGYPEKMVEQARRQLKERTSGI